MHSTAISGVKECMFAGTSRSVCGKTDLTTFEFCSSFRSFVVVPAHPKAFLADGDTIVPNRKVIFIDRGTVDLSVQVNERLNVMIEAVFIVGHGVMFRFGQKFGDMCTRKELPHREVIK